MKYDGLQRIRRPDTMRHSPFLIELTPRQEKVLEKITKTKSIEHRFHQRAYIIIGAALAQTNTDLSKEVSLNRTTVRSWRKKWLSHKEKLAVLESEASDKKYYEAILDILSDDQRPGAPLEFTPEQVCQIISVACEVPENSGYPVSHWSYPLLREEVIKRGIVESISVSHVGRFLKSGRHQTS
jgi:putative transposase